MKHLITLLATVALVALLAGPLWAPSDQKPEKIRIDGITWDAFEQAFVLDFSAVFGIGTAGEQGVFTIDISLEISDARFLYEVTGRGVPELGEGSSRPLLGDLSPLQPISIPWNRNDGTVTGEIFVDVTAQLLNPSGQNVGSEILRSGIPVTVGPPRIGGGD